MNIVKKFRQISTQQLYIVKLKVSFHQLAFNVYAITMQTKIASSGSYISGALSEKNYRINENK